MDLWVDIQIEIKLGIDCCSGSLGHGISVGCGVALSYLEVKKKIKFYFNGRW